MPNFIILIHVFRFTTHNCDDVDSLGVARIALGGDSATRRETVVKATPHVVVAMPYVLVFNPGNPDTETLVYIQTTFNESSTLVIWSTKQQAVTKRIASSYPAVFSTFVQPKLVTFPSLDGEFTIHAQLFDTGASTGGPTAGDKKPGVIFTHGGCQRQMYAAFHYAADYAGLYALNQFLAARGHVVLSVNYRGGPGYGVRFRAANGSGWQGASEYQDTLGGAKFLQSLANVDPDRIGIHGLSYGGLNAMQAVSRNSDVFKASVANAPVVNWITQLRYEGAGNPFNLLSDPDHGQLFRALPTGPGGFMTSPAWLGYTQANQQLAWASSPAANLDAITSPLLLIQGDSDANVDFAETVGVVRSLRARGFDKLETLMVPDDTHGFSKFANQLAAAAATEAFLTKVLKPVAR